MRGLIATTALLAGVQAAVDPIVIKVTCHALELRDQWLTKHNRGQSSS